MLEQIGKAFRVVGFICEIEFHSESLGKLFHNPHWVHCGNIRNVLLKQTCQIMEDGEISFNEWLNVRPLNLHRDNCPFMRRRPMDLCNGGTRHRLVIELLKCFPDTDAYFIGKNPFRFASGERRNLVLEFAEFGVVVSVHQVTT